MGDKKVVSLSATSAGPAALGRRLVSCPHVADEDASIEARRLKNALQQRLFGAPPEPQPTIGRFEVCGPLGRGGMGVVFRARDPSLDREVALKLVRTRERGSEFEHARARMLREAKVLARLQHPNVVTIHETGVHEGEVFVAMELLGGGDLAQWAERNQTFDRDRFDRAFDLLLEAGRGLAAAHAAGIVHRDFKPSNVMLGVDGHARVGDFGLARAGASPESSGHGRTLSETLSSDTNTLTTTGTRVGTRAYMPPEQARGEAVGEAADQYAFCVTAVEVLTGRRPSSASEVPLRVPGTPRRIWAPLRRGMGREPASRWPSVQALLDALERVRRRRWPQWVALGAAAVAVAALARPGAEPAGPTCDAGSSKVEGVWSPARRNTLRESFADAGVDAAPAIWAASEARLTTWLSGWSDAFDDTCKAHHVRGELSTSEHDARARCLDTQLRRADALLDVVEADATRVLVGLDNMVRELPNVQRCSDPIDPRHDASIPADPERAADYAELLDEVARRRAMRELGQWEEASQGAIELAQRAAAHPNTPLFVEATIGEGLALSRGMQATAAIERTELAARMAATLGAHELEAQAWMIFAEFSGRKADKFDVSELAHQNAKAAVDRLVDPRRARAKYLVERGSWLFRKKGDTEEGAALISEGIELLEALHGPESSTLVGPLQQLANAQSRGGKTDEADATLKRALDIADALGPTHPLQIDLLDILAANASRKGDFEAALDYARRATDVAVATHPADAQVPAIIMSNEAVALLEAGHPEQALTKIDATLQRLATAYGPDHYQVGGAGHRVRAAVLWKLGRLDEALESATKDIELCTAGLTGDHFWVAVALQQRADIHREREDWEAVLADDQEALRIEQKAYTAPHVRLVVPFRRVAADLRMLKRYEEAAVALGSARESGGSAVAKARTALEAARLARARGRDTSPWLAEAEEHAKDADNPGLTEELRTFREG